MQIAALKLLFFVSAASAAAIYPKIDLAHITPYRLVPEFARHHQPQESRQRGRIVGGEVVVPNSFPFHTAILLVLRSGRVTLCGGTLLSPVRTLTAAHCVATIVGTTVIVGGHNIDELEETQQRVDVPPSHFRIHPDYNEFFHNDIAILLHPTSLTLNTYVQPTRLPTLQKREDFIGETATIIGHGMTGDGTMPTPILRESSNVIVPNAECENAFGTAFVPPTVICMSTVGKRGICSSDSGGSLLVYRDGLDKRPIQIGVSSYGGGCESELPNGFTRVTDFLEWIDDTQT